MKSCRNYICIDSASFVLRLYRCHSLQCTVINSKSLFCTIFSSKDSCGSFSQRSNRYNDYRGTYLCSCIISFTNRNQRTTNTGIPPVTTNLFMYIFLLCYFCYVYVTCSVIKVLTLGIAFRKATLKK